MNGLGTYRALSRYCSFQYERYPKALEPNYALVDERSLQEVLAYTVDLSKGFSFIADDFSKQGNWSKLFLASEICLIAKLAHFCEAYTNQQFTGSVFQSRETKVNTVIQSALSLDEWLQSIRSIDSSSAASLSMMICKSIREHLCFVLLNILNESSDLDVDISPLYKLSDLWAPVVNTLSSMIKNKKEAVSVSKGELPDIPLYSPQQESTIDRAFFSFVGELSAIANACSDLFESLLQKQAHDPTVAMVITFIRLYSKVQEQINSFASRHLRYYYFDVLKIQNKKQAPHSVFISANLKPQMSSVLIDDSQQFYAIDKLGEQKSYQAQGVFSLSNASIRHIQHVNVARDPLVSPEQIFAHAQQISLITRDISAQADTSVEGAKDWPLFGEKRYFIDDIDKTNEALGFAIACDDLLLGEGSREINVDLELRHNGISANLVNILARWNSIFDKHENLIENQKACLAECFNEFDNTFSIEFLSTLGDFITSLKDADINEFFAQSMQLQARDCLVFYLLHSLQTEQTISSVQRALGLLFTQQIMSDHKWLSAAHLALLKNALIIQQHGNSLSVHDANIVEQILLGINQYRSRYFISDIFNLTLSSELGWLDIKSFSTSVSFSHGADKQASQANQHEENGFTLKLQIKLEPSDPAIIGFNTEYHEGDFDTEKPILKVSLNPQANYYGYNLLDSFRLNSAYVKVSAKEVSSLSVLNQLGRLDMGSNSMIFGPTPSQHSSFYIGSFEAAKKNVTRYQVNLAYTQLPNSSKGFEGHYLEYPQTIKSSTFELNLSYLNDGNYTSLKKVPMFKIEDHRLKAQTSYSFEMQSGFPAIKDHQSEASFAKFSSLKNGMLRLSLNKPNCAFGHDVYPSILAQTMTHNARLKFAPPKALPEYPYTPTVDKISLSYQAEGLYSFLPSSLRNNPASQALEKTTRAELFHFSSFGTVKAIASSANKSPDLLPLMTQDANLLIAFDDDIGLEYLSIYFEMKDNCELNLSRGTALIEYRCYSSDGWLLIPDSDLLLDSTCGLTQTGIVTLKLPKNKKQKTESNLPAYYWLNVSTSQQHQAFPSVTAIRLNVVSLQAKIQQAKASSFDSNNESITSSSIQDSADLDWRVSDRRLSQLAFISEQGNVANIQTEREQIQACSEKLRHKNRPVTALDFEQYVLEQFPSIFMTKCFSNIKDQCINKVDQTIQFSPGHLMVVVLPHPKPGQNVTDAIGASSTLLAQIREALIEVAPMFVSISVVNPTYERLQVRCSVKLKSASQSGLLIKQLNQDISSFFDPFLIPKTNYLFGWKLTCEALSAHIRKQSYIEHLTNFSILHISKNACEEYFLQDSVTLQKQDIQNIQSHYPWCLPLPDKHHVIDIIPEISYEIPNETGIDEMKIGNNFIVGA